jgi:hypothetical protein
MYFAMAKAAFNKKDSFYQQIGLEIEEETSKMLHLEHGFVWCWRRLEISQIDHVSN